MDKKSLVLAALSPSKGLPYTAVQVQKMFFLIDRNIANDIGGPLFNFQPYSYGPFDAQVYWVLEDLQTDGDVQIIKDYSQSKTYQLTMQGQTKGDTFFSTLDSRIATYLTRASEFVRSLSFADLVSAIYKAYPDMKVNSVFREA